MKRTSTRTKPPAPMVARKHASSNGTFQMDLRTDASGKKSLRIRCASANASQPAELVIPGSQAYQFMEAVIHFVASMEKKEMQNVIKGKRKATVKLSPQD